MLIDCNKQSDNADNNLHNKYIYYQIYANKNSVTDEGRSSSIQFRQSANRFRRISFLHPQLCRAGRARILRAPL